jgi:hypothetical protein
MVLDERSRWREVWPNSTRSALVTTATAALPVDEVVAEHAQLHLEPEAPIVLMTDGMAEPIRDGPTTVAPALADALRLPPTPLQLAVLADFSRHGCHDDRTLLAVWMRSADAEESGVRI